MSNNELIKYVLNEQNKLITREFIQNTLKRYGIRYKISDINNFQMAMTHETYIEGTYITNAGKKDSRENKLVKTIMDKELDPISEKNIKNVVPLQKHSYERLEFLGDSIFHAIVAEYLYARYPDKDEGFLTKLRTKIENGQTLSRLSKDMQFNQYVLISRNVEQVGGRDKNNNIFEDIFEAFLGALYIDSGYDFNLCKKYVVKIVEEHIDTADMIHTETNHKDTLLQYFHKMKWPDPIYNLVELKETNNKKIYNMCVRGPNREIVGTGSGNTKKKAEQLSAYNALCFYDIIKNDESEDEIYDVA